MLEHIIRAKYPSLKWVSLETDENIFARPHVISKLNLFIMNKIYADWNKIKMVIGSTASFTLAQWSGVCHVINMIYNICGKDIVGVQVNNGQWVSVRCEALLHIFCVKPLPNTNDILKFRDHWVKCGLYAKIKVNNKEMSLIWLLKYEKVLWMSDADCWITQNLLIFVTQKITPCSMHFTLHIFKAFGTTWDFGGRATNSWIP